MKNTALRWALLNSMTSFSAAPSRRMVSLDPASSPLSWVCRIKAGTTRETTEGMKISERTPAAVMRFLFHNMIVVTSPIGEKAPPLLAAMMTREA